ncbi:hypothetical protein IL306_004683 [Fusarium sp. DS 682]|nr:hypothetical protein IL306_004683 [Fusarium sp. DS 682]
MIILYESKGEVAPYAALSYCWGGGVPLRTTMANLAEHRGGIPLAKFPETLRDVIPFARALGFQYIWIDALCIVQDDAADWAVQAAAMTAIYHGCALNIAIADAPSCDTGIVKRMGDAAVCVGTYFPSGVRTPPDKCAAEEIWAFSKPEVLLSGSFRENFHLSTRGWVFQECLVSVATVYLSHGGLAWDCCSGYEFEDGTPLFSRLGSVTMKHMWAQAQEGSDDDDQLTCRFLYTWVTALSLRKLTVSTDKLPAVAGLASRLSSMTSLTYVAGLWKEDLHAGLSWHAVTSQSLTRNRDQAPSWSWASVDGPIWYHRSLNADVSSPGYIEKSHDLDLEILQVSVDEIFPGSFGQVRGGHIEAVGTLWRGTISGDTEESRITFETPYDSWLESTLDESRGSGPDAPCWLLRLASFSSDGSPIRGDPWIHFLILEETEGGKGEFRRIGYSIITTYDYNTRISFGYPLPYDIVNEAAKVGKRKIITLI